MPKSSKDMQGPFKDCDRICFIGDSITQQGFFLKYIYEYYITRFPKRKIAMKNCGVAGDCASDILIRLETDIFTHNPNKAVLMVGINDIGRELYSPDMLQKNAVHERRRLIEEYSSNIKTLVGSIRQKGIDLYILTPSHYDQTAVMPEKNLFGCNDALGECSSIIEAVAKQYGCVPVDLYKPMNVLNTKCQMENPAFTIIGSDRVHPGYPGHLVMAYLFLKQQGVPFEVASARLDAKAGEIIAAANCSVCNIIGTCNTISFDYKPYALPMAVDGMYEEVEGLVPLSEDLNVQTISISGLAENSYSFEMDGENMGIFSAAQLKTGVNVALIKSNPYQKQAMKLHEISLERYELEQMLRVIKFVEKPARYNPIEEEPDTIKAFLYENLERMKGKPWYDYVRDQTEKCFLLKPHERSILEQLTNKEKEVYMQNQPDICRISIHAM